MFPSLVRRDNLPGQVPFDFENNPYKAKKQWPPDFSKLSSKYQFRLERRYRRRAKLAWARPRWTKFTKLVQYGASLFVVGYGVLYYDWGQQNPDKVPFQAAREWYKSIADSIWTHSSSQLNRENLRRTDEARHSSGS